MDEPTNGVFKFFILLLLVIGTLTVVLDKDSTPQIEYDICYDRPDTLQLAYLIASECSICNDKEKYLVGSVVLNRAEYGYLGHTRSIINTISQENQFHGYKTANFTYNDDCFDVARDLLNGEGRFHNVFHFFARDSPNKAFVKSMKDRVLYSEVHHLYSE